MRQRWLILIRVVIEQIQHLSDCMMSVRITIPDLHGF
jgi:hypothetical protein